MRFLSHGLRLATAALALAAAVARSQVTRDVGKVYAETCASCHDGGKGPDFRSDKLKHGEDEPQLVRSIREGYPEKGMPAFDGHLHPAEVQALVTFVRERIAHAVTPNDNFPLDSQLVRKSELHSYRIEAIVDQGLEVPWSFVFLPDGRILLTERAGRVRIIDQGRLVATPVAGIPQVIESGEGGLLSIALHPDYAHNGWIYLAFSDPGPGDKAMTKIVRGRLQGNTFADIETIFSIPVEKYQSGYMGFGCRMEFAGDRLYFSVGDRDVPADAQLLDRPNGKIHRVLADGRIPDDNPFVGTPGAFGSIWTYGHRNPQGLAFDPRTQALWESEHGPRGGDELNYLEAGKNYGWPVITYGINYDGTAISDKTEAEGMEQPIRHWTPSIATSQIAFYTGDRFPKWKNNLFLGSLAQQRFIRFEIDGRKVVHEEEIFKNLGRIRDIKTGPDGLLYVAIEQLHGTSGRLVRLVPAD